MPEQSHFRKLERMMHSAPIHKLVQTRLRVWEGGAEITLPVQNDFFHSAGALHGSISFLALDNAAFFAANSLVEDVFVLTTTFTIYFTRPVSQGSLRAEGRVLTRLRRQFIAEAVLFDSEGQEAARGSGLFVRSRIPLSPDIGYAEPG